MPYHIPKQIHTGFQDRDDTYTGKLSFSTYVEEKTGQLKHDNEWKHWCNKEGRIVLDNKPMKGFMFNRNKTHHSNNYYFNTKRIVFRVYHPEGFEFEIKPDNVNLLLEYTDISKKEITDPCIIAFSGKTIVLLPITSPEYQDYIRKEEKRNDKNRKQNLKKEFAYKKKDSPDILLYAGKYDFSYNLPRISYDTMGYYDKNKTIKNLDVFYNLNSYEYEILDIKKLSTIDDFVILKEHREKLNINPRHFNYCINDIITQRMLNISKENLLDNYENFYIDYNKNYYNNRFYSLLKENGKLFNKEIICVDKNIFSLKRESFKKLIDINSNSIYNNIYTININMINGKTYSLKNYLSFIEQIKNLDDHEVASMLLEFSF